MDRLSFSDQPGRPVGGWGKTERLQENLGQITEYNSELESYNSDPQRREDHESQISFRFRSKSQGHHIQEEAKDVSPEAWNPFEYNESQNGLDNYRQEVLSFEENKSSTPDREYDETTLNFSISHSEKEKKVGKKGRKILGALKSASILRAKKRMLHTQNLSKKSSISSMSGLLFSVNKYWIQPYLDNRKTD